MVLDFDKLVKPQRTNGRRVTQVVTKKPSAGISAASRGPRRQRKSLKVQAQNKPVVIQKSLQAKVKLTRNRRNKTTMDMNTVVKRINASTQGNGRVQAINNQNNKKKDRYRNRKGNQGTKKQQPIKQTSASQLDQELNKYWEQDEMVMKERMDDELDTYFAAQAGSTVGTIQGTVEINNMGEMIQS